jgi:hypothetical protein
VDERDCFLSGPCGGEVDRGGVACCCAEELGTTHV